MKIVFMFSILIAIISSPLASQENSARPAVPGTTRIGTDRPAMLSQRAEVSLLTIHPGKAVYSAFGHSAIRIRDEERGLDLLFNYGQALIAFDVGFVPRFLRGELPFILGVVRTIHAIRFYSEIENRTIEEQVLELTPAQREALHAYLTENARPENRLYLYDFFMDNCATRVRDLFDVVLGGDLTYRFDRDRAGSFRDELAPYLAGKPFLGAGIDLILGMNADRMPTDEETLFLPLRLFETAGRSTIRVDGESRPFVTETRLIYRQEPGKNIALPVGPSLLLWAFFLLLCTLTLVAHMTPNPMAVRLLRILDTALFALAGTAGAVIAGLWLFADFALTDRNLNLLWAWPTHLAAIFLLHARIRNRLVAGYFGVAALAALGTLAFSPVLPQVLPAVSVPLILALTLRGAHRAARILAAARTGHTPSTGNTTSVDAAPRVNEPPRL